MRKPALLLILLLVASSTVLFAPVRAEPKVIVVPDDYPDIQSAVNQAHAGDTVHVKAGNYNGTITIQESIALIGDKGAVINAWIINGKPAILITHNNVTVKGITIDNPTPTIGWSPKRGIHLLGASNCVIENNVVAECYAGEAIWLYQSQNNLIEGNTVESSNSGIRIGLSTNNIIINNTVTSNNEGISVYGDAQHNLISGNTLFNNKIGLSLSQADWNEFTANTITSTQIGLQISDYDYINENTSSSNNTFYHNNFNNPQIESYALSSDNRFDNGREGNYYSDYKGQDLDGDGIGDSPYTIVTQGADLTDRYPLMKPWIGNLPPVIAILSPENTTYNNTEVSLTFTINKPTSKILYILDNNDSAAITGNTTLTGLTSGNHSVVIYATDSAGNEAVPKTASFTVDAPVDKTVSLFPIAAVVALAVVVTVVGVLLVRWRGLVKKP
jgi:nitrous oxidase accessory protein